MHQTQQILKTEQVAGDSHMSKLLLIDDDQALSQLLSEYLVDEGFDVTPAYTGQDGLNATITNDFDIITLDIMLPGMSGLEVLKQIRQQNCTTPVLMLTAKGDDVDRILGLELGADDYLPKPCNPRELLARLKAILRRSQLENTEPPAANALSISHTRMEASFNQQPLKLTGAEFKLLEHLSLHIGQIVSKEDLCQAGLGRPLTKYDRSVDVHVSNVRKKLVAAGADADVIINQRGSGYLLKADRS